MAQRSSRNPPITRIEDGLYIGGSIGSRRREMLQNHGITAVVSLSEQDGCIGGRPGTRRWSPRAVTFSCPATIAWPTTCLAGIYDFIHSCRESGCSDDILVHCNEGVSRSPTALVACFMRTHRWNQGKEKRRIKPNENFKEQLGSVGDDRV